MDYEQLLADRGLKHFKTCTVCGGGLARQYKDDRMVPRTIIKIFPIISKFTILRAGKSAHSLPLSKLAETLKELYEGN